VFKTEERQEVENKHGSKVMLLSGRNG